MKPTRSQTAKTARGTRPRANARVTKETAKRPPASSSPTDARARTEHSGSRWTFLTNHSHVLILLSRNPSVVLREVAAKVGITERAVQRIIADLEEGGFIEREKVGRQNHYRILADRPLRHPVEAHRTTGDLIRLADGSRGTPNP